MKCVRCNRPLSAATISVHKGKAVYAYGPKCARLSGLMVTTPRQAKALGSRLLRRDASMRLVAAPDESQLALEFVQ